ncbi:MAG TPA: glycoside hydrolase family 31 protein, partial [Bacteroidota bacterium]|nr:glycoside hydrolase family 31 protein [Bacteroidota bacterium]
MLLNVIPVLPQRSKAQWRAIGPIDSLERVPDGVVVSAAPAKVHLSVLAPDVIRIRMSKTGTFLPDSSWAVVGRVAGGKTTFDVRETKEKIEVTTSALTVSIQRSPCRIAFYNREGTLINKDEPSKGMGWSGSEIAVWKSMPEDEQYFGFGEKAGSLNRKWKSMSNWNSDIPGYHADTDPLYETIPFFYGIRNGMTYGIFFDNTYFSYFNMGKEHPEQYSFGAIDGEMNYYFIYGPTPKDVLRKFSSLVGTMPLPPKWAIAYQQCRYSYYPEKKVRAIAENFRSRNIPCDVIYLDIHYMDEYRCFTWDTTRFAKPKKMLSDLAKDGFKTVVIIDPGIKEEKGYFAYDEGVQGDHFVKYPDGRLFIGKVWPGMCAFPDFTKKETRAWWGSLYKGLIDAGIRGFWNDMNEPAVFDVPQKTMDVSVIHDDNGMKTAHRKSHNVYGMQMARGTFEGNLALRPDERPFVLTRASYAGGNRYAAAWTGDNISSWEHLELAIPMCLNLSISGQPFVGTDIGGFVGSPSGELYARWLQLGVFTPLMRTHTVFGSADQEPWSYGKKFEAINRKSIELRYKLLPYIYTQFYLASQTGIPMMRPIFFDYPDDRDTYWNEREFLFGDALLVAPVVTPGDITRSVRLPGGTWYDYWTGKKYAGPNYVTVDAPIDRIPVFVKAGAIIPAQQIVQYSDQAPVDPLTVEVYPNRKSSTVLYEDDGKSFDYREGKYCLRTLSI